MDINHKDGTSHTTQYEVVFLKYVENKYCAKHRQMSIIKSEEVLGSNLFPSANDSGFAQSCYDAYHWSSDDEE